MSSEEKKEIKDLKETIDDLERALEAQSEVNKAKTQAIETLAEGLVSAIHQIDELRKRVESLEARS